MADDVFIEPRRPAILASKPEPAKPDITHELSELTDRVTAFRVVTKMQREVKLSKLAAIADRIKTKKEAHDKKADEWAARLDAIDKREPEAFEAGDHVLAERETDLADMEATMRALSNLPNASAKS